MKFSLAVFVLFVSSCASLVCPNKNDDIEVRLFNKKVTAVCIKKDCTADCEGPSVSIETSEGLVDDTTDK